ncbi:MAG: DUF2971 domain-containing protein [Terracidiphilus sp.]|nr:DUF2971 domain-containing protein [Terracidiphilus sp.]MDR3776563.1 DUF2971 domain-containing protein [Terracidiphilus sp.]
MSQSIWATHIRYLNDSSEYKHGLEIIKREVLKIKVDPSTDLAVEGVPDASVVMEGIIRNAMSKVLEALDETYIFVASFFDSSPNSSDVCAQDAGDMLGQWRAYSGGSAGFSIGFDKEALSGHILEAGDNGDTPVIGGSCIYDVAKQERYLHDKVAEISPTFVGYFRNAMADFKANKFPQILEELRRSILHGPTDETLSKTMEKALYELRATFSRESTSFSASITSHITHLAIPTIFMKDPAFSDEKEWRIAMLYMETPSDVMFRAGKSSLIPYIAIPLPLFREDGTSLIRRIVVGPSREITDAVAAVRMLLGARLSKVLGDGESGASNWRKPELVVESAA